MIRPDPERVAAYRIASRAVSWDHRDVTLYALGLGLGADPVNRDELPFVYEEWGQKVMPTFATIMAYREGWASDTGIGLGDAPNVHGDETVTLHRPFPSEATLRREARIAGLYDRGAGSHAILVVDTELSDDATGETIATLRQTDVLLGAGGFGGDPPPKPDRPAPPDRAPDAVVERAVMPQAALLYRLSGDHYELHAEPAFAREAGFDGPILHGLCTYGMACHAVIATCCDHDPDAVARFHGRFTAPVYPGEILTTELWRDGSAVHYRCRVASRNAAVIDNGRADLRG